MNAEDFYKKIKGRKVFLYGEGICASILREKLLREGIEVVGYVVSDGQTCKNAMTKSEYMSNNCIDHDLPLLYAIDSDDAFYQLVMDNIPVIYIPKEWMKNRAD